MAMNVMEGVVEMMPNPMQVGSRRGGVNYYMPGYVPVTYIVRPGVGYGQPQLGGGGGVVQGRPVTMGQPAMQTPPPAAATITVDIPASCAPGQPFQFVHPATGQVMQALAPMNGDRRVEVAAPAV